MQTAPGETFAILNTRVVFEKGLPKDDFELKNIKETAKLIAKDTVVKVPNSYDLEIAKAKTKYMAVVYEVPNMTRVQSKKNITYKTYGNNENLGLDIYYPLNNDRSKKAYLIIMIPDIGGIQLVE